MRCMYEGGVVCGRLQGIPLPPEQGNPSSFAAPAAWLWCWAGSAGVRGVGCGGMWPWCVGHVYWWPRLLYEDVINAILYFRFQDRWTRKKRQEAHNVAQKACSTLFLNTSMATLCEFIRQAAIMARQDREVRCLPHEFLLMQPVVRTRYMLGSAGATNTGSVATCVFFVFHSPNKSALSCT